METLIGDRVDDFLVGDVIEVKWHEFDAIPEIGTFIGIERGYYLLMTREGNVMPFLINNVIIKKMDAFPIEPLPLTIFLEKIKENKNICILFFSAGALFSLILKHFFYSRI
jgi:hypothetical protein